jgi:uncharacterized membrane protein YkoI
MRNITALLVAAALLAGGSAGPVLAQASGDQSRARQQMQSGQTMSSRDIERRIIPQMKGHEYLGFEYDGAASAYRLKFIDGGQVVWVDVDARTGRILRVSK